MTANAATLLLQRLQAGDGQAGEQLFPLVYEELHRLAERYMSRQNNAHTLQPTALVHEAYVKLIHVDPARLSDGAHFFRLAASAMRSILVDHARARQRVKRGGDRLRVTLDDPLVTTGDDDRLPDLLDLDAALERLGDMDKQLAEIVEARFFGGLTVPETASLSGVSARTVERGWRVARAWLLQELGGSDASGDVAAPPAS